MLSTSSRLINNGPFVSDWPQIDAVILSLN